jgi:hypothetical protein
VWEVTKVYSTDFTTRCRWRSVKAVPAPYQTYIEIWHDNAHVGEIFRGKSGRWFGFIFGKPGLHGVKVKDVAMHLAGLVVNPGS